MESINVVATTAISEERRQKIISISPRIKLTDVSDLIRAEQSGNLTFKEKLDDLLAEAEVILWAPTAHPQNLITRAPKLKWIQTVVVGVNSLLDAEMVASSVILTNTRGIPSIAMSEFVLQLMLMFVKQAPLFFQLKREKQWRHFRLKALRSKTVGIIGLGSIGREVARLAKAFSMRVLAVDIKRIVRARYVDIMLPSGQLPQLLAESDFVVLSVPLTPETSKLIGEKELRSMKPTAYLINIARGRIVDEEALIHALDEHWIAGAGLDVFATEPLPTDSRLWELPNVILSPHISSGFEDADIRVSDLFIENLRRYLNGEKLLNVINKKRGY